MRKFILNNYSNLKDNVKKICKRINRDPKKINIVIVSKNQELEKSKVLLDEGHMIFGENRIKEGHEKWKEVNNKKRILHFIGALQSKKVKNAMEFYNVIETLDTEKSAKNIAKFISNFKNTKAIPKIFIQVNIGNESQKRGVGTTEFKSFLEMCRNNYNLNISGGMCMAPINKDPEKYFSLMNNICKENNLLEVSMGMSNDYEQALLHGSTNIRVGSLIFGKS